MHVHRAARRSGAPRVTLLTEGTYPHSHGGVSVWCDQLVTGMPDVDFDVLAVTAPLRHILRLAPRHAVLALATSADAELA
ncbi:DUF3492 domain-containing protein, partial [Streptomyces sp. NPDC006324]|uniref:DUF3492 domain-containing protein n=1 Tax=Streptomyces sp. NPDC006324 TaxID=3156751 RepID=UPI0033A81C54